MNIYSSFYIKIVLNPLNQVIYSMQDALNKQEGGNHYKDLVIQPIEYIVFCKAT